MLRPDPGPGMGMYWILSDKSELQDELSLIKSTLLAGDGTAYYQIYFLNFDNFI